MLGDDQIFENRHPGKQAHILEGAGDTSLPGDLEPVHPFEQQRFAVDVHDETANARLVEAGKAVEDGGLAGAVRSDNGGDLAGIGSERQIVDRDQPAEAHRQMLDEEQRLPDFVGAGHGAAERRVWRRSEGSRCPKSPRGRHTMIATIAAPKISMRNSAKARPNSGKVTSRIAASTTPIWLPMPPSTTIARIVADSIKVKLSGLMKPCRVAKKQPAKPPSIAPMPKAESLTLVGLMPNARQATSSSRRASQARPIGSRRRREVKRFVTRANARMTK